MYILILPFPPSINDYYGITCNGSIPHKYIKTRGKEYRSTVRLYAKENNLQLRANIPIQAEILINSPDNRTHDLDNILKCLFDSLTEAEVIEDDKFIRKLTISYGIIEKGGSIFLNLSELQE